MVYNVLKGNKMNVKELVEVDESGMDKVKEILSLSQVNVGDIVYSNSIDGYGSSIWQVEVMKKNDKLFDIKLVKKVLEQVSDNSELRVGDILEDIEHTDEYYYDKRTKEFESDTFFSTVPMKRFV